MSRPIRVAMVSASFYPYIGGAEKQALELSRALAARGVLVSVLTRRVRGLPAREMISGLEVRRLAAWGKGLLNAATFMASLALYLWRNSSSYDVVHAHLAGSPALAAALVGRWVGKPVIIKLGGGRGIGELAASSRTAAGRAKLRLLAALRPRFAAVSADLAEELKDFGLGACAVRVLANGVDVAAYRPAPESGKSALRARFGWPEGLGFLYVGRLSWEKRLPQFLEIWSRARESAAAEAFVVLIGEGPERRTLEKLAARSEGRIILQEPTDAIASAYAAADVFILPSISEGLSNSLLEAMASGLGILASRVGGTVQAIEDGKSGLLFDPENREELSEKLKQIFSRPKMLGEMGLAARTSSVELYSIEQAAARYEAFYREILS